MSKKRRPAVERLPEGVQLPPPRVILKDGAGKPLILSEDQVAIKTARHLHAILPGANPRRVIAARPGRPATYEAPHPWAMWWHTPNEGRRSLSGGKQAVDMGLRAGVYDLAFLFRIPIHGAPLGRACAFTQAAFIELKRPDGGVGRSPDQERFGNEATALGAWTAECWSVEEVDATLRHWLKPYGMAPRVVPIIGLG